MGGEVAYVGWGYRWVGWRGRVDARMVLPTTELVVGANRACYGAVLHASDLDIGPRSVSGEGLEGGLAVVRVGAIVWPKLGHGQLASCLEQ